MDNLLSERQRLILRAIVDDYVQSAEPVGSRTISKREDVGYSPATIRNEMSDLEEMGYLEQPHTSAGRIPSQKGYRFFVDHLIEPHEVSPADIIQFKRFFTSRMNELEQVVQQTAIILSQLTNYTSIVLGPDMPGETLKHVQIVPLSDYSAVAIIVTNTGHVENRTISIPKGVSVHEIEKLVNLLNQRLSGVPLQHFKHKIYTEMAHELRAHIESYEQVLQMLEQVTAKEADDRLYLGGTAKMLNQPEFKDVEKAKGILELLEQNQIVLKLIGQPHSNGLQIKIGQENGLDVVSHCSIITAAYSLDGLHLGTIGIIGPTRMEYRKVIGLLNHIATDLPMALKRWYK
jgi:heat-inducible transcriptional repressor